MEFTNLADIIAEEVQGEYSFVHEDRGGYNALCLKKSGKVIMYDMANRPIKDIYESNLNHLQGDVLICGAGCGFAIFPIKDLPAVKSITVIENDATIIAMLQPYLPGVIFIDADATSYKPTQKYDSIFLDIWDHNNPLKKYSDTIRYKEFLSVGGYINYLDFESHHHIVPINVKEVDYKIQGYHKKKTQNELGDRVLIEFFGIYSEDEYACLKVKEIRNCTRQSGTGVPLIITVDIEWIGTDGTTVIASNQLIKHLDLDDALDFNEKSRKRLIHKAKGAAMQLIGLSAGKAFMRSMGPEISLYKEGDYEVLVDAINASAQSQTFKDILTSILNVTYVPT